MRRVSFIVPAHNEERLLGATLDALHAAATASGHDYDVTVVDDASTDATAAIAARHGARVLSVDLRHIAAVRNAGAAAATGDYFVFVDADTLVNAPVLSAALRALDEGAVGGGARVKWEGRLPWWGRVAQWSVLFWMRLAGLAAGCFFFARREAFVAAGGFEERVYASEELFLSRALKRHGKFVILPHTVVTSGRKFRTYTTRELLAMTRGLGWLPWRALGQRDRLTLWYGERRHDD